MGEGYYGKITFTGSNIVFEAVKKEEGEDSLQFYYRELGCGTIDIVSLTDEIDLVVDDSGMLKTGNYVFEIDTDIYVESLKIAGPILVGILGGKYKDTTVGFGSEEAVKDVFLKYIKDRIKLIGTVR